MRVCRELRHRPASEKNRLARPRRSTAGSIAPSGGNGGGR
ncbi:hypothetical protein HMPREF0762_00991 [Slackia exigua ATCC 700122]|uniref:Uncharacterized protein n=1 Tax=Slackia exigua (strain ATCC 700122 / DSM 15923 / CIP 105133 / JCM 11022 / KCTC 5966 / S-7) TaxID=649764 RepID=D0WGN7_SLAES|nr:hypothetical protein HMPREF0762_00991 [Slackia exigua ATCC 700122]